MGSEEFENDEAIKILNVVKNKISARDGFEKSHLVVLKLVNEATDPANLCRMYHGWMPYI